MLKFLPSVDLRSFWDFSVWFFTRSEGGSWQGDFSDLAWSYIFFLTATGGRKFWYILLRLGWRCWAWLFLLLYFPFFLNYTFSINLIRVPVVPGAVGLLQLDFSRGLAQLFFRGLLQLFIQSSPLHTEVRSEVFLTPALLWHKDTAQGTVLWDVPLIGQFLAFYWFFMALGRPRVDPFCA